jgi:hypothetical protein
LKNAGHLGRVAPSMVLLAAGIVSAFSPTLRSGFRLLQTDQGDTRLVNYILEHSYRWAIGWLTFRPISLWDQPMFFPTANVAAYSEVLLGSAPIYWLFRALRFEPDTSMQLWMIAVLTVNFAAMDLFLRRCLRLKPVAVAIGAFLFAFAGPRVVQMGHQQLLPQFFTVLAMYGAYRFFDPAKIASRQAIYLFFLSAAAQLWAGYYLGWFLFLAVVVLAMGMLASREHRARIHDVVSAYRRTIAIAGSLSLLLIAPMAYHYLRALRVVGPRHFVDAVPMIPPLQSWLYLGPDSWLYSWQRQLHLFQSITFEHEQRLGIGWITLVVALAGCYRLARDRGAWARSSLLSALTIVLAMTLYAGGFTPWRLFFNIVPGANAIRAVSRIVFLMLVPLSIGLAWFVETRKRLATGILIGAICVLEQGHTTVAYDKVEARRDVAGVASLVNKECAAFYFSPVFPPNTPWMPPQYKFQIDAALASAETGVPTINGYSGNLPKGWFDLWENAVVDETSYLRLRDALGRWNSSHHLDPRKVCWIGPSHERVRVAR